MAKEKFTLDDLKVNSFVTTLDNAQMKEVKGGTIVIKGRRFMYTTRWTTVDTTRPAAPALSARVVDARGWATRDI